MDWTAIIEETARNVATAHRLEVGIGWGLIIVCALLAAAAIRVFEGSAE